VRKICVCKICAISFIGFFTTFASAQLPSGGNGFFGYSYLHGETFANGSSIAASGPASMSGWEASVEGKYLPWLGAVADLGWNYGGRNAQFCVLFTNCTTFRLNASRDTLLFGPRASVTMGRYRPFAEVLLGVGYESDKGGGISNSDISFAYELGGGVDYHLVRSVSLRGQVQAIHTSFFGQSHLDPRISTGIVFSF